MKKWNITRYYKELLDRCGECGHSIKVYKMIENNWVRCTVVKCGSKECQNRIEVPTPTRLKVMITWNLKQRKINKPM